MKTLLNTKYTKVTKEVHKKGFNLCVLRALCV